MNHELLSARRTFRTGTALLFALALLLATTGAQTARKNEVSNDTRSIQLELVRTETGFFEAWKTKDEAYFREHMPENGIFWAKTERSPATSNSLSNKPPRKLAASKVMASPTLERYRSPPAHTCSLIRLSNMPLAMERKRRST